MTKYIDMPSWAAQWLVFEISGTPEPNGPSSWYTYKDKNDDKWYCGPPWDFDYKSFVPSTANQWISANAIYMPMMLLVIVCLIKIFLHRLWTEMHLAFQMLK